MSGINYGLANKEYQPVIAPDADKVWREKNGFPVPARPAWLCITSPEHSSDSPVSSDAWRERTPEEQAEVEAKKEARKLEIHARQLAREAARQEAREVKKRIDAMHKEMRAKRAQENKARGFPDRPARKPLTLAEKKRKVELQRERARRERAESKKRFAQYLAETLPAGYVRVSTVLQNISRGTVVNAIKEKRLPGILIRQVWYCDPKAAKVYADTLLDRQRERIAKNREKIDYAKQSKERKRHA